MPPNRAENFRTLSPFFVEKIKIEKIPCKKLEQKSLTLIF
jgi:hypothetical protein